jgi:capsular polysaccharide biosynthesis protein
MDEQDLLRSLFKSEWDAETETFAKPEKSTRGKFTGILKKILTGSEPPDYVAPNPQRLSNKLAKLVNVSVDKKTGYLAISAEAADPQNRIDIIQKIALITDDLLKKRYVSNAKATLAFYEKKITLARSREQREALAKLMAQEDQRLMLAARGKNFVVEPLMRATTSLYPTSPKASLILALSIVLGGFLGSALVLIRASLQTRGDKPNA